MDASTIANICWLIQTFKYQCSGSMRISNRFWCIIWKQKRFLIKKKKKYPHYIIGYLINFGPMFFIFSLFLNLAYIGYSLCQIWSVYTQCLRCCDHSNKCLFLVIQQAEVLLNFWWVCIFDRLIDFRLDLQYTVIHLGPHLPAWFLFNPNVDKWLQPL